MDIVISVGLPVSLAIIMLSLGIGLTIADFRRVFTAGWAFVIGALCQVLMVPAATFAVILMFGLTGELAAGFMLLSFCPGGVTSNLISKFAKGDVALSVSLTAAISLLSMLTVPLGVAWAVMYFMGDAAPEVSVTSLAIAMFVITAVPVGIGVAIRHVSPGLADRIEPRLSLLATVLFIVIVVVAVASNWAFFLENLGKLGPALIVMNAALMALALAIAALTRRTAMERRTIAVEAGIQTARWQSHSPR